MGCHNSVLMPELSAPHPPKNPKQLFCGWHFETRKVPCDSLKLFLLGGFLSERPRGKGRPLHRISNKETSSFLVYMIRSDISLDFPILF